MIPPYKMRPIEKISINSPCEEDWSKMTPQNDGRFCDTCAKCVVDFTQKTNEEVIEYFKQTASNASVCGRFSDTQLHVINSQLSTEKPPKKTIWTKPRQWLAASISALFLGGSVNITNAQSNKTEVITHKPTISNSSTNHLKIVKGYVFDEKTREALIGTSIIIKGTNIGVTVTESNGYFELTIPQNLQNGDLVVSYITYKDLELPLTESSFKYPLQLFLENDENKLDEVKIVASKPVINRDIAGRVTAGAVVVIEKKPSFFTRVWRGIKGIFRRKR